MSKYQSITNVEALQRLERYQISYKQEDLAHLYVPYMEMVFAIGMKYFKDQTKAEDLVINVYEILTRKALSNQVLNFSSWLYTLAKNECLMELRKKRKEISTNDFSYQENFMESKEVLHLFNEDKKENQLNAMEFCLDKLNPQQKLCVEQFYLANKSYKEIAEHANLEYKEVKSNIQNGKRNLKNCIEDQQ